MEIRPLNAEQLTEVYQNHMRHDFPPLELRSLKNIRNLINRNEYTAWGFFDGNGLLGYALLICHEKDMMIDYFAIMDGRRGEGLGSEFLRGIVSGSGDADSLMAEIEDPDAANTEEEKLHRRKRRDFYTRNGFRDTGGRVCTFGVRYQLIECGKTAHTAAQTEAIYARHYQRMLPPAIYKKFIRF